MTEEELQKRIQEEFEYWANVLRMQDWDIQWKVVRASDQWNDSNYGQNRLFCRHGGTEIKLVHLADLKDPAWDSQWELFLVNLVHELLHTKLPAVGEADRDSYIEVESEKGIDQIATALVRLSGRAEIPLEAKKPRKRKKAKRVKKKR